MSSTPPPPSGGSWGWDTPAGQQGHWPTPPIRPQQPHQPPRQPQQQPSARQQQPLQPQFAPPPPPRQPPQQQAHQQQHYQQQPPPPQHPPGTPPPKRSRGGLIALIACLVLVLGVGVGWGLSRFLPGDDGSVTADPTQAPTSGTPAPTADAPDAAPDSVTADPDGTDALPDDPSDALTQIAETDREEVVADLEGKWVPQISSKRAGMEIDGETWTDEDILADHQALRDEHPRVRLLWSGDFGSFKENDFWVTIAGIGYSDPDQALSWCATNGLGPDDCYAKQLNTGGDDEGTTRLQ